MSIKRSKTNICPPPEFLDRGVRYTIDTCAPQLRASHSGKIELHALTHGHYPGTALASDCLPGLTNIGFWDACGPQDWGLEPHRNEGIEIVFLETGRLPFTVDGQAFVLDAGSVSITRPWQLHCLGDPHIGPGRLHWLILDVGVRRPNQPWQWPSWVVLDPADLQELTRTLRHNEHPVWRATPELAQAFHEIASRIPDVNQPHAISHLVIQLNQLLLALLEALQRQGAEENPELTSRRRVVELFLQELLRQPRLLASPWTLAGLAKRCGMGSTSFAQCCRLVTNQSPMDWLNRCRLDHAARLLSQDLEMPILQVAKHCGFSSSQYFATRFRQRFGTTPRSYRSK